MKLITIIGVAAIVFFNISHLLAQTTKTTTDTSNLHIQNLPDITVVGKNSKSDIHQLPEVIGTFIYAGKKNALVIVNNVQGNVVMNNMRQVLAKVPGIHIWESDPSGIQIGIAARGLSPNRSWEFNTRQNGYDIAADPYGYPEAYYNPPLQGVQRIEIVRGQGALQYGPQFGGMVNYILKNGSDIQNKFSVQTEQTIGSNSLYNFFGAVGGQQKNKNYYTYFDHRIGKGWRENSAFFSDAGFTTFTFSPSTKLSITAELMLSHIRSQQPGGLTDQQFNDNSKQSVRNRNWLDVVWSTPAISINYSMNENTKWNTKIFATIGNRNSIGFILPITINDSINATTNNYNHRTLTSDKYRNVGVESKIITNYTFLKKSNTLLAGIRLYKGNTARNANGKGTVGTNYDMTLIDTYPLDIQFQSTNMAIFVEHIFRINNKLIIIPGGRFEWLAGSANGRNGYDNNGETIFIQNIKRDRSFLLLGMGAEYHLNNATEFYSNFSEAYRPIQFSNLQAQPTTDIIDPNLSDGRGYNFDFGYRGKIKSFLQFDVSTFYLDYRNRIGVVNINNTTRMITNVGNCITQGIESMIEINPLKAFKLNSKLDAILFSSYSFTKAKYSNDFKDANTKEKLLENAPTNIIRTGVQFSYKKIQSSFQYSFVDEVFSDANNTILPSANAQTGLIPAYSIVDCNFQLQLSKKCIVKWGINNLLNTNYFTRRSSGYPGPGILPANGRTFFASLAINTK